MKLRKGEKSFFVAAVIFCLFSLMISAGMAHSADQMITGKVTSATQKITKNGDAYTILVIPENKELNGVKYTTETSVFCFKSPDAKAVKAGDTVKMIAKRTVSKDGNEFVTLISLLK